MELDKTSTNEVKETAWSAQDMRILETRDRSRGSHRRISMLLSIAALAPACSAIGYWAGLRDLGPGLGPQQTLHFF